MTLGLVWAAIGLITAFVTRSFRLPVPQASEDAA